MIQIYNKSIYPLNVFLTLSDPESEEMEEAEECCWGLEIDMGESALWGDTESLCWSSTPTPSTQPGSCSGSLGSGTATKRTMHGWDPHTHTIFVS